jgi:fumarate reductase subunit D
VLSQALRGEAALESALRWTDSPVVKFAEWGLVVVLTLHLVGGIRLILIEFGPWRGVRSGWITATVLISGTTGFLFLYSLVN